MDHGATSLNILSDYVILALLLCLAGEDIKDNEKLDVPRQSAARFALFCSL